MKQLLLILLITLFGFVEPANAQPHSDYSKYKEYSKYLISRDSIKPNWLQTVIGFNQACDIIFFQNTYYSVSKFNKSFKTFLLSKSATDTIVLQLDYGNDVSLHTLSKSFKILEKSLDKYEGHGTYYFSMYPASAEQTLVQTDTIQVFINKKIVYKGKVVTKDELSSLLKSNKPDNVIVFMEPDLPMQDLLDVLQIGNDLMITMVLQSKKQ